MATFYFKTQNKYIDGKIEYSYDRSKDGYNLNYNVQLKRNNRWNGTHTHANMSYTVYANGSAIHSGSHGTFHVYNGGAWYSVVSGTKWVSLNSFTSGKQSIGFSSSGGVEGLSANYQYEEFTVGAYAAQVGVSRISINDNGKNKAIITTTTGNNGGDNNKATDCHVYGTTDGSTPNSPWSNYDFSYNCEGTKAGNTYTKSIDVIEDTTIKAIAYTIASLSGGNNTASGVASRKIFYYARPTWKPNAISLEYNTSKPTPKSIFTASWANKAVAGNTNSPIKGYRYKVHVNGVEKLCYDVDANKTSFTFSKSGNTDHNLSINAKDEIYVTVHARTTWGTGEWLWDNDSVPQYSTRLIIESPGVMRAKINNNEWVEGQAYIKTLDGWKESTGILVKTTTGWEEST